MNHKHLYTAAAALVLFAPQLFTSCGTPKNVSYFQDVTDGAILVPSAPLDITVRPEDKLSILVNTQDPALTNLFNLVSSQNRVGQTTSVTNGVPRTYSSSSEVALYTVDAAGDINFPVLGKLHIGGMTRREVSAFIEGELEGRDLIKDPVVTVEFANAGISVIGEVNKPGRYEFNKDHVTILDALAMAGDLGRDGMRQNVIVFRQQPDGTQKAYRIDLTNMSGLTSSPVYYMQQSDVIYVEPNDKKKRETTPNGNTPYTPSFWVSIGPFAVTIATLITTLAR